MGRLAGGWVLWGTGDRQPELRACILLPSAPVIVPMPPPLPPASLDCPRREEISTWPLVKVCRLRHNWPVLATGAMLVDLPGVRDANAARGRVAESYLKVGRQGALRPGGGA